jgi:hypothetical protein
MKFRSIILIFISLATILLLTSCSPWVVIQQGSNNQWIRLISGRSVGQTFVADYSGLQAVNIFLKPQSPGDGILTLHLRSDTTSPIDLATIKIPIQEINTARSYRFDFPDIASSSDQYYYAFFSIDGEGSVDVGSGPASSYQDGAAYVEHNPLEAQLAFSLTYDRQVALIGIFRQTIAWFLIIIVGAVLFSIPGWALMSIVWRGWADLDWFIKFALSIGISYTLYVLLMLYTFLLHMQLGMLYALFPVIISVAIIIWRNRLVFRNISSTGITSIYKNKVSIGSSFWPNLVLVLTIILMFFARFWDTRGLKAPMWGDSVQHTVIVQLIIDNQGLFNNWLPYAPYETMSMHFGFPVAGALIAWLTKLSSTQAVLYAGQILIVFAALAVYPMAVRLAKGNRWAGVLSVIAAGLISPMPAYYINWGRYAQLAGQVILPILLWLVWDVLESSENHQRTVWYANVPWIKIIIGGMTLAAMVLCQFRMPYYFSAFLLAWIIMWVITYWKLDFRAWYQGLFSLLLIGIIGFILFLPWGLRLQHGNLINIAGIQVDQVKMIEMVKQDYQVWGNITFYVPLGMIIVACLGLIWAVIKRDWQTASIGLWFGVMASIYSLMIIGVPGSQFVTSFSVLIAIYIPISLLFGYALGYVAKKLENWRTSNILTICTVIILGFSGAWQQRNISQPDKFAMVTNPDIRAMNWIREEIPIGSRFLVEGFRAYWGTSIVGSDAGWWIPFFTEMENTMPPQYALTDEVPIEKGYSEKLVALVAQLEQNKINTFAGIKLLCDFNITHIYIGQEQGMVGNFGSPLFTPTELEDSSALRLIYHQDRVYIFSLNEAICGK